MFSTIYVPLDNSEHSNAAAEVALSLAHAFGSRIVGSHVYAARMHDYRFKQMEYTLPEEYQDEQELERQRKIHDTLITRGLRLISDSYTDTVQARCAAERVPFEPKTMDGRNWQVLVEDINESAYDLVVMGAQGFGATKEAQLGSVCERVVRRIHADTLIIKDPRAWTERPEGSIAVCIDGSPQSFGGLRMAIEIGKALGRPVEAVAVYDPYLHYAMFNGIVNVLSAEASKVFRFKEQEQLHEEIIDTGLAKIYESHLQVARRVAEQEGVDLKVTLLDGKAWEKIVHWARTQRPWLLVMGRIGVHSDEQMDIGSNSENLLRAVGCNVLLASSTHVPPVDVRAEEVMVWTPEASQRMERVPAFVRGVARTAIHRWALERGTSVISSDIIDQACMDILPPSAARAMGIMARRVAVEELAQPDTPALAPVASGHAGKTYICGECGYAARDVLPVVCPVCRSGPERFAIIDPGEIRQAAAQQGPITEETTFDGQKIAWTEDARRLLFSMTDAYARRRAKARIEKQARMRRLPAVTVEFASPVVQEMLGELSRLHANSVTDEPASDEHAAQVAALPATVPPVDAPHPAHPAEARDGGSEREPSDAPATEPAWTEEAIRRIERVPAGYMRDMTRDLVLQHAAATAAETITLEVCEAGIELAKQEMTRMITARAERKAARSRVSASGGCPVATGQGAPAEVEGCPIPGVGAQSDAHLHSAYAATHAHLMSGHSAQAARAEQAQASWPSAADALNEIKPAFIARLSRYYAPGSTSHQVRGALDFVWTPEAERLLAAVPAYCRELARWRVEWTAYTLHLGRLITLDVWQRDHADWSELSEHLRVGRLRRLDWDAQALDRLQESPLFVREQVALAAEINATHLGYTRVSGEAFEAVTRRWLAEAAEAPVAAS